MPNVAHTIERSLSPAQQRHLRLAAEVCTGRGVKLFLVGGTVRDLLLGHRPVDLDLSAVGGNDLLAAELARALEGEVVARSQFGTAKIRAADTYIDLALARKETYANPGALPKVAPGSIQDDLARRDFSINATAVCLDEGRWGELVDPHRGREDTQGGLVRVLHPGSFIDDATRIIRAVRYSVRLGFRLEPETEALLRRDLPYMGTIGGDRVRNELIRIFREERAVPMLETAREIGVLAAIHPSLAVGDQALARLEKVGPEPGGQTDLLFLSVLAFPVEPGARPGLIARLNMDGRWARVVRDTGAVRDSLDQLAADGLAASTLHRLLNGLDLAAVRGCALATDDPRVTQRLELYDVELRHRRPALKGDDLMALGVPEGPEVGEILDSLVTATLDGLLATRDDEVRFVVERLERRKRP
ncbi:MAG: CCA tRNA nucleotidyltransferase [Chloroflexi bacterium]|nr:CCA tRNA nucleotidyltransferase [Chloroflexota bacterium]